MSTQQQTINPDVLIHAITTYARARVREGASEEAVRLDLVGRGVAPDAAERFIAAAKAKEARSVRRMLPPLLASSLSWLVFGGAAYACSQWAEANDAVAPLKPFAALALGIGALQWVWALVRELKTLLAT